MSQAGPPAGFRPGAGCENSGECMIFTMRSVIYNLMYIANFLAVCIKPVHNRKISA